MRGCWWWDSNPQGLTPRDLWDLCVYQFRHTSTYRLRTLAIPKAKTQGHTRAAARDSRMQAEPEDSRSRTMQCGAKLRVHCHTPRERARDAASPLVPLSANTERGTQER